MKYVPLLWNSDNKMFFRKFKWICISGVAAVWVQRVHLHPWISTNGCIVPVLMKTWPINGPFSVQQEAFSLQKGAFWCKKCSTILNFRSDAPVLSGPWRRSCIWSSKMNEVWKFPVFSSSELKSLAIYQKILWVCT